MKNVVILLLYCNIILVCISCLIHSENTENEPNDTFAQANHILLDADDGVQASIDPADDQDFFHFDGLPGETYTVTAECQTDSLDIVISMYDTAEAFIDSTNLFPASGDETISFTASASGICYIQITSFNALSQGDYVVSVITATGK